MKYGKETKTNTLLTGYGNEIQFKNNNSFYNLSAVIAIESTSNNNLIFDEPSIISDILTGQYDSLLSANLNMIQLKNIDMPKDLANNNLLFNHTHKYLYDNILAYTNNLPISSNFYLKDNLMMNTYPLAYSNVEIGSIIGWPQYKHNIYGWLPKPPDGFYNCSEATDNPLSSFEIPIDVANPTDKFFNGQLAELMNANITDITFNIPNIPAITGEISKTHRLIYIIKYNNNIEYNQTTGTIFEI